MNEAQYVPGMMGCSDGGCIFNFKERGTMVTNGGCSCQRELVRSDQGLKAVMLIQFLRANWPSMPFAGYQEITHTIPKGKEAAQRTMLHKVTMIVDVRQAVGCGLKEAKEAVDNVYELCDTYDQVIDTAVSFYNARNPKGYCIMEDNCLCTEAPERKVNCFEWRKS